ncbi:Wall-associated receptor kinase, C-terminal [Dillenia turbinata]|uniref:non-specific serine/threonine protein kinase n=1 Tax=Dillenia turbinata TaxID=194707 RepID=A0AAN8YXZ2_9MAGN
MASPSHHVMSSHLLFLIFIFLLYASLKANCQNPSNFSCPSFKCGDGTSINYPFWHQEQETEYCGYPGFGVLCSSQRPILHLSDHRYYVESIDYSQHTMILAYTELDATCPRAMHNVTLKSSPLLSYGTDEKMLIFVYNCSVYPASPPPVACLRHGIKQSFVFLLGSVPDFDWYENCETIVSVPVMGDAVNGVMINGYDRALQEGFRLTWQPDGVCQLCEATGGFCKYGLNQTFSCICSDGQHSSNCYNNDATGAVILFCVVILGGGFYLVRRHKLALQHLGFSRLPTSQKL